MFSFADALIFAFNLFAMLMGVRNIWVYEKRIKILHKCGIPVYDMLPSYPLMVLKFWVWDIDKFFK